MPAVPPFQPSESSTLRVPKLQVHKATGQAFVRTRRDAKPLYLGKHGTPEADARYARFVIEWQANLPLPEVPADQLMVVELVAHFFDHARVYYRHKDGRPTGETASFRSALQPLVDLYGSTRCRDFGPRAMKVVRQRMIDLGWERKQINKQIGRVKHLFRWGTEEELVPAGVHHALVAVRGLQCGRTAAPELEPVKPAPPALVEAVKPYLSPVVWDMLQLELRTGGRPQDMVNLKPGHIDRSGDVWIADLPEHKTAWRGHRHKLLIGPEGQAILAPYLLRRRDDEHVFSASDSAAQRRAHRAEGRRTPLSCGNRPGSNRVAAPMRQPGCQFSVASYRRAIARGCEQAARPPEHLARHQVPAQRGQRWETRSEWRERLGERAWTELLAFQRAHRFTPNQLRHAAATMLRRRFGIDVSQTFLGHRIGSTITEIYAEADLQAAARAAQMAG